MNEKIENQELEQMRQQFDMLKAHLSEHRQLKEEQIKATIKNEITWKTRQFLLGAAISVVTLIYLGWTILGSCKEGEHVKYLGIVLVLIIIATLYNQGRRLKRLRQNAGCNMIVAQRLLLDEYKRCLTPAWWKLLIFFVVGAVVISVAASLVAGKISGIIAPTTDSIINIFVMGLIFVSCIFWSQKCYKEKYERLLQQIEELEKLK